MTESLPWQATSAVAHTSFDSKFFDLLFDAEERHFWFCARNQIIAAMVSKLISKMPRGFRVLEVGCGNGNTLRVLERVCQSARVAGVDLFAEGLLHARRRVKCPLIQADLHQLPFAPGFDLICLFDVLEHIPDDLKVLHSLRDMLSPTGKLLLTVPAHASLWSYFDEASHHCRRYERKVLNAKLKETGYHTEYLSEFMVLLFPLMWGTRRFQAFRQRTKPENGKTRQEAATALATQELRIVPVLNDVLRWLLGWESLVIRWGGRLPLGTSLMAVAATR